MNAPNNRSAGLIVYGSYAPGGENHSRLAFLRGEWRKGFIMATRHEAADDIGPGEAGPVEAWLLTFEQPATEDIFSPEYDAWRRELHLRWLELDDVMGPDRARNEIRWWPEGSNPVVGTAGMQVVNAYLPLLRFPHLADRDDVPHPDDADDLNKLWGAVKRGEKKYDWSIFIALIKDADPADYENLFGDLPGGASFVARLRRLFQDHKLTDSSMIYPGGDRIYYYVCPLSRNARPIDGLLDLARRDVGQRAAFLRQAGLTDHADVLGRLRFEAGSCDDAEYGPATKALEEFEHRLRHAGDEKPRWHYCLAEACYGIAANYALSDWLMLPLAKPAEEGRPCLFTRLGLTRPPPKLDLDPSYEFWRGGGTCVIDGGRCVVGEVERRDA